MEQDSETPNLMPCALTTWACGLSAPGAWMHLCSFKAVQTVTRLLDSLLEWSLAYNSLPNSLQISVLSLIP